MNTSFENNLIEDNILLVSVCCITYNHERYIRKAIESFINQKTNFQYEIIIHDDASTDNTRSIVNEYVEKYPELISLISQRENQYSKDIDISKKYILPKVKGKYTIFCEGDDYWTNPNKLQIQVDALEKNPQCCMCVHYTKWIDAESEKKLDITPRKKTNTGIVDGKETFYEFFHISSRLIRTDIYRKYINNKPDYAQVMDIEDIPMQWFLRLNGSFYFIDKCMSVYNKGTVGSFTARVEQNKIKRIEHLEKSAEGLRLYEKYVESNEKTMIHNSFVVICIRILIEKGEHKNIYKYYKNDIQNLGYIIRTKCFMYYHFPWIAKKLISF